MKNLTPQELLAISKLITEDADKAARKLAKAGNTQIDVTLHVRGWLRVGEATDKAPTCSIPWKLVTAMILARMGATKSATEALLIEVISEALKADKNVGKAMMEKLGDPLAAAENHVQTTIIDKMKRTPVNGAVTFIGEVESEHLPMFDNDDAPAVVVAGNGL